MQKRIFSGIQPSGDLHIGNYLGALRNWIALQEKYDCVFCVVDYHAVTIPYEPQELRERTFRACADLLACGIDPRRSRLFVQSMVPEHTELAWILSCHTSFGDLERMTQFKEKSDQHRTYVNAGLFTYPVLQTADIALYKATLVPVGEDQRQHLELAREIVRRFNGKFGPVLEEPEALVTNLPRVLGLDGDGKMSKSKNNYLGIMEEPEDAWKKLSVAKTDENRKRKSDPGNPEICNIYTLHKAFADSEETLRWVEEGCRGATIGCIECKRRLFENMERELGPIRERRKALELEKQTVYTTIEEGAAACRQIAEATMKDVRSAIGVR